MSCEFVWRCGMTSVCMCGVVPLLCPVCALKSPMRIMQASFGILL